MVTFRRYPAGVQDFAEIREGGFVYVDKTRYIYDLANTEGDAIFLNRPRRFGKSLLCSTLKYYFQGRRDLFEGLSIDELETKWTQYPVLHFDMSRAKSQDAKQMRSMLSFMLSQYEEQYHLTNVPDVLGSRLQNLVIEVHCQTGNKTVLIFDEYDAPVLHVIDDPDQMDAVREIYSEFFGPVKSMAEHLRFVFITGITKFSQMSIFSTINHLTNISMDRRWEGICGITAQELDDNFHDDIAQLAQDNDWTIVEAMKRLRTQYDGYRFGPALTEIYNPFSLLHVFRSKMLDDYWFTSGTPSALIKFLSKYPFSVNDIEGCALEKGDFDLPFDDFSTAIPVLYQSGYLTIKDYDRQLNEYTLGIPNGEVYRGLYKTLMGQYLNNNATTNSRLLRAVKQAMLKDDIDQALQAVQSYMASLPHHLSSKTEQDFETILRVLFDAIGIEVDTEVQSAIGRCDVVLKTPHKLFVLELKLDGNATVDDALAQIDEKNYLISFWDDPRPKVKVGVVLDRATRTLKEWKTVPMENWN